MCQMGIKYHEECIQVAGAALVTAPGRLLCSTGDARHQVGREIGIGNRVLQRGQSVGKSRLLNPGSN